jgi:hypothetical protein
VPEEPSQRAHTPSRIERHRSSNERALTYPTWPEHAWLIGTTFENDWLGSHSTRAAAPGLLTDHTQVPSRNVRVAQDSTHNPRSLTCCFRGGPLGACAPAPGPFERQYPAAEVPPATPRDLGFTAVASRASDGRQGHRDPRVGHASAATTSKLRRPHRRPLESSRRVVRQTRSGRDSVRSLPDRYLSASLGSPLRESAGGRSTSHLAW